MARSRFPLDSDQLELLLAFERAGSLEQLAKMMARDVSVVSRNLARIGSEGQLLVKQQRKWTLTEIGKKVIAATHNYLEAMGQLLTPEHTGIPLGPNPYLLIINAQMALQSPALGSSSNPKASMHIGQLLEGWRQSAWPIIHGKHVSDREGSLFHRNGAGCHFMPGIEPREGEVVLEKGQPSAFLDTNLAKILDEGEASCVVMAGFTAQECIDSTAKQALSMGYKVVVIDDAVAQFGITGPSGKVYSPSDVHEIVLSGLAQVATVVSTSNVLHALS